MITIYCLVNPVNKRPFYVGATRRPLKERLSGHLNGARNYSFNRFNKDTRAANKIILIRSITKAGFKPTIEPLLRVEEYTVDHYERFFFEALRAQGYDLHQHQLFDYDNSITKKRGKITHHQLVNMHNKIIFKNTLIISW